MNLKNTARLLLIISVFLIKSLLASEPTIVPQEANLLREMMGRFANSEGTPLFEPAQESPQVLVGKLQGRDVFFYGIEKDQQPKIDFRKLKTEIARRMGLPNRKLVQIVGDSAQFGKEGTQFVRKFLRPYFEENCILEYGFTGYSTRSNEKDSDELDVNTFLNEYITDNPGQAYKVLANVVGHSIVALEQWGCKGSPSISHYVMVYNQHGMKTGFTTFGDDVMASDYIQSPDDGDILLLMEGGPQSFRQSLNVLQHDVPVKAIFNIRSMDRRAFFSAAEFFSLVKKALAENPDLSPQSVQDILAAYLKTHQAWDPEKPDADTKEKIFYSSVEEFINKKIFKKLLDKVEIIDAANASE